MVRPEVQFSVPFVKGKGRPRFTRHGGVYTPKETERAEDAIKAAFTEAAHRADRAWSSYEPYFAEGPVWVAIESHKPIPKSRPRRVCSEFDLTKPDLDNIEKLVLDALNKTAYKDDTQVIHIENTKLDRVRIFPEYTAVRVSRPRSRKLTLEETGELHDEV